MADSGQTPRTGCPKEYEHISCWKYEDLFEYHLAISGKDATEFGSLGYQWKDKPHRLVYNLTSMATDQRDKIYALELECARLEQEKAELSANLRSIEFSASGYCPACWGWEVEKGRGCNPKVHTEDCWLDAAALIAKHSKDPNHEG